MRIALACATLVASLHVAAPVPARAAAHYSLAAQKRAAKYGGYSPVVLTDSGLAAGVLSNNAAQTNYAYYSDGKFFSEADFCGQIGAPGETGLSGISLDAALTYTVGVCYATHFGYVYNQAANTTTKVQYPGAISTFPYGVNANGITVGEIDGPPTQGFSLLNGTFTPIKVPGAYFTIAQGINAANVIFGNYYMTLPAYYGFVLAVNGQFTTISYPGATFTQLAAMNSQNMTVGLYENASGPLYAFASQNGSYYALPLPTARSSRATAVNDDGDVAGWYIDSSGNQYGFVWRPTTNQVIKVKGPKGSKFVTVTGINNTHAQITGSYQS
jgi:uncharacterized membrane protein